MKDHFWRHFERAFYFTNFHTFYLSLLKMLLYDLHFTRMPIEPEFGFAPINRLLSSAMCAGRSCISKTCWLHWVKDCHVENNEREWRRLVLLMRKMLKVMTSPCRMTDSQFLGPARAERHEYWLATVVKRVRFFPNSWQKIRCKKNYSTVQELSFS